MNKSEVRERFATFVLGNNVEVHEFEGQLYASFADVVSFGMSMENLWRDRIVVER